MKNIFLTLALLLTVSFAFAGNSEKDLLITPLVSQTDMKLESNRNSKVIILISKVDTTIQFFDSNIDSNNDIHYKVTSLEGELLTIIFVDCTVEYDITVWLPGTNGPTRIKGTTTFKGVSCMELLKGLTKKI